jgi:hypothetical protein
VKEVISKYDESQDTAGTRPPRTWPTIKRAAADGYLDEAIFMHLLDAALVPEFVEFRRNHSDRLIEYVSRYLAVLP